MNTKSAHFNQRGTFGKIIDKKEQRKRFFHTTNIFTILLVFWPKQSKFVKFVKITFRANNTLPKIHMLCELYQNRFSGLNIRAGNAHLIILYNHCFGLR